LRFSILWAFVAISLCLFAPACDRGDSPDPAEPLTCVDHIEDEAYLGSYRALLGVGDGAYKALQLFFDSPGRFNVVAALNGPSSAVRRLAALNEHLENFDLYGQTGDGATQLQADRDLVAAFGNAFYINPDSAFFPPGVTAADFDNGEPVSLPPMISPVDPDGIFPVVTVYDDRGAPVDFVLAHDLNANGQRDAGEPLVLRLAEPYDDVNDNGAYDPGESFDDVGLDGVDASGDYGEANGRFDANPRVARWLDNDPINLAATANIPLEGGYAGSIYLDSLREDPRGYNEQTAALADVLALRLDEVDRTTDDFCIVNTLGRYDDFLGDYPVFTNSFWLPEKFSYFDLPASDADFWSEDDAAFRAARLNQALRFLSLRMPNGLDDSPKEAPVIWQVREFFSDNLQNYVRFGVGFPAGYFDDFSNWKTFPVLYVFHDSNDDLNDLRQLLVYQGDLARRLLAKQALIIVVDGTREAEGRSGFSHYVDQAADEFGGDYGVVVEELITHVESRFRVQIDIHDRDDD